MISLRALVMAASKMSSRVSILSESYVIPPRILDLLDQDRQHRVPAIAAGRPQVFLWQLVAEGELEDVVTDDVEVRRCRGVLGRRVVPANEGPLPLHHPWIGNLDLEQDRYQVRGKPDGVVVEDLFGTVQGQWRRIAQSVDDLLAAPPVREGRAQRIRVLSSDHLLIGGNQKAARWVVDIRQLREGDAAAPVVVSSQPGDGLIPFPLRRRGTAPASW